MEITEEWVNKEIRDQLVEATKENKALNEENSKLFKENSELTETMSHYKQIVTARVNDLREARREISALSLENKGLLEEIKNLETETGNNTDSTYPAIVAERNEQLEAEAEASRVLIAMLTNELIAEIARNAS